MVRQTKGTGQRQTHWKVMLDEKHIREWRKIISLRSRHSMGWPRTPRTARDLTVEATASHPDCGTAWAHLHRPRKHILAKASMLISDVISKHTRDGWKRFVSIGLQDKTANDSRPEYTQRLNPRSSASKKLKNRNHTEIIFAMCNWCRNGFWGAERALFVENQHSLFIHLPVTLWG